MKTDIEYSKEAQQTIASYKSHIRGGFFPFPVALAKAKNATIWDVDGNEYIDFLSFFAVTNMGHSHPKIVEATCKAIETCAMTNTSFINPGYAKLGEKVEEVLGYKRIVCMCSGADASDTATKLARKWGYLKKGIAKNEAFVLTASACYHGLTISTHSFAASKNDYFGPYVPLVGSTSPSGVVVEYGDIDALTEALEKDHDKIAAFMIEPIQGSAGMIVPPEGYLKKAYDVCKKYNVLFIADEVQTGLGRAGAILKSWDYGVKPDLVCLGKALAGGAAAISAVGGIEEVMDVLECGDIGSTMAANPPATSAAVAALDILIDEKISEQATEKGALLKKLIAEEKLEQILSVSGEGVLLAAVLNPKSITKSFTAARLAALCVANGLILNAAAGGTRIRLCPPATISTDDIARGVKIFADCVRALNSIEGPILGVA